jgi:Fur family ferric uptake transcriptional regulator
VAHENLDYEAILRNAGHRVTRQRLIILDAVCEGHGHTTLKQVFSRVREVDDSIDQSSLYRTFKLFMDLGLVVSATTDDGETYYEIAKSHKHHHLICRKCGKQQEIAHDVVQVMFDLLAREYGFRATTDHLVITGLCQECDAIISR